MQWLDGKQFQQLMEPWPEPCVSVYLPTHRAGPELQQDRTRLKNLVVEAEERLIAHGLRGPEARELLQPARELIDDSGFWRGQCDGLAIFLTRGRAWHYRLPRTVEELVTVGSRFHLTPMLPILAEDGRFYILCLSQNHVRLLACSRDSAEPLDVPQMPTCFEDLGKFIDAEKQLQWHTEAPVHTLGARSDALFHGHGAGADEQEAKGWLTDYCHAINKALTAFLRGQAAPLLLASAQPLEGYYRAVNDCPHLLEEVILGNVDHLPDHEIHQRGWAVVQPLFARARRDALATFQAARGTPRAVENVEDVLPAADDGRIQILLVADSHCWGRYDPRTRTAELESAQRPRDEDLLNTAAIMTQCSGGEVYVVPQADMPVPQPLAAVLRY